MAGLIFWDVSVNDKKIGGVSAPNPRQAMLRVNEEFGWRDGLSIQRVSFSGLDRNLDAALPVSRA